MRVFFLVSGKKDDLIDLEPRICEGGRGLLVGVCSPGKSQNY